MIPELRHRVCLTLEEALPRLQDGDLLQYRGQPWSPISWAIRSVGRSVYCHTAMVARVNGHVECLEVRELWGGRITDLSWQLETFQAIDVYRPAPHVIRWNGDYWTQLEFTEARRQQMVNQMRRMCRPKEYGYLKIVLLWLTHLPLIRWLVPIETNDKESKFGLAPFCAEAYCHAMRLAYVDPVPNKPDWLTEPGDLTRSPLLDNYLFTLVPGDPAAPAD